MITAQTVTLLSFSTIFNAPVIYYLFDSFNVSRYQLLVDYDVFETIVSCPCIVGGRGWNFCLQNTPYVLFS